MLEVKTQILPPWPLNNYREEDIADPVQDQGKLLVF